MNKYFVFVACGDKAVDDLIIASKFLRKFTKQKIIAIIGRNTKNPEIDNVINIDIPQDYSDIEGSRYLKTGVHKFIGNLDGVYCYLDNDVYAVSENIDCIFEYKNYCVTFATDHNVFIDSFSSYALNSGDLVTTIKEKFNILVDGNWPLCNGGVFLFDEKSIDFLNTWHDWTLQIFRDSQWKKIDQGALTAAIWCHGLQNNPRLSVEFNWLVQHSAGWGVTTEFRDNKFYFQDKEIKFMHFIHKTKEYQHTFSEEYFSAMSLLGEFNLKQVYKKIHLSIAQDICNQNCIFCYKHNVRDIPAYDYTKLPEILDFIKNNHVGEVIIQGGEPTIVPETYEFCQSIATDTSSLVNIMTNGQCFDENWQKLMNKAGSCVNFSLNSPNISTYQAICPGGDLMKSIENIIKFQVMQDRSLAPRCKTSISMVVCQKNIAEMADFYELAKELHVDEVRFFPDISSPNRIDCYHADFIVFARQACLNLIKKIAEDPCINCFDLGVLVDLLGLPREIIRIPELNNKKYLRIKNNEDLYTSLLPEKYNGCSSPWDSLYIDHDLNVFPCCNSQAFMGNLNDIEIKKIRKYKNIMNLRYRFLSGDFIGCSSSCQELHK